MWKAGSEAVTGTGRGGGGAARRPESGDWVKAVGLIFGL